MNDLPKTGSPCEQPDASKPVEIGAALLHQLVDTGSNIGQLFLLELQLALGDARRLLFLMLLVIPFVLLAWLGFCVLLSWLVIDFTGSISAGLLMFLLQQLFMIRYIQSLWRRYSYSLSLPMTRHHLQSIFDISHTGDR